MIPSNNDDLQVRFKFGELPTNTHQLHISRDAISGFTDRRQAMIQAIYLILNTERYQYLIYSWNYGVELADLFGKPPAFCIPEIKRRVTEALTQDTRVISVDSFEFAHIKGKVRVIFVVHTIYGDIDVEKVVDI